MQNDHVLIENDTSFNLMHHLESGDEYILSSLQLVFSMVEARDNNMKILIVIFWFIEDFIIHKIAHVWIDNYMSFNLIYHLKSKDE